MSGVGKGVKRKWATAASSGGRSNSKSRTPAGSVTAAVMKQKQRPGQKKTHHPSGDGVDDDDDRMSGAKSQRSAAMNGRQRPMSSASSSSSMPLRGGLELMAQHTLTGNAPSQQATDDEDDEEEHEDERSEQEEAQDDDDEGDDEQNEDVTHRAPGRASASSTSAVSASPPAPLPLPSPSASSAPAPAATSSALRFRDLRPALDPDLLSVIENSFGFSRLTPVQQQTIPTFMQKDVLVQSYTGSGKTLAFVVPMLHMLLTKLSQPSADGSSSSSSSLNIESHTVVAIILSPTRELATQISSVIAPFVHGGEHASPRLQQLRVASFIGGSSMPSSESSFVRDGGNILVATPGRLNSALSRLSCLRVSELRVLILDEADRLLDEGFAQDVSDILRRLPKQRRTGLFSATQTSHIRELRRAGLQEKFAKIQVLLQWKKRKGEEHMDEDDGHGPATSDDAPRTQMTPTTLHNFYTIVKVENKLSFLIDFICNHAHDKLIVFFLTGDEVEYFFRLLPRLSSIYSRNLHKKIHALRGGKQGMEQSKRNAQLAQFVKEEKGGILLATDVAARGIDVPDVDWIVQYDPPKDPSVFVHRIGRTARMGRTGRALAILTPEEAAYADLIHTLSVPMARVEIDDDRYESHHTWRDDPDVTDMKKAMEEGRNKASQMFETIKKRQQQRRQQAKKASNMANASDASSASSSSCTSPSTSTASSSLITSSVPIRSVVCEARWLSLSDRLLLEKGAKAFTSFVDGYKQHVLTHALNYTKLPFAGLAKGLGLLYLPKMPDLKHLTQHIHYDQPPIKPHLITFKDAKLQADHEKKEAANHLKNQKEQEERERLLKEKQKRLESSGCKKKKKKLHESIRDEWEELQRESRLIKKLKKKQITKEEFEIAVGERKGKEQDGGGSDGSDMDSDRMLDSDDSSEDERPTKKSKVQHGSRK